MLDAKWKFLLLSIVAYQALLTWVLFDLVNRAAHFSQSECGSWCEDQPFGYILSGQGAYDTAKAFGALSLLLILANIAVWIIAARRRRPATDQTG